MSKLANFGKNEKVFVTPKGVEWTYNFRDKSFKKTLKQDKSMADIIDKD